MTANNKKLKKYLELFELEQNYSIDDLKTARKDLLHAWHPDKHSHSERAIEKAKNKTFEINKGYDYLKDLLEKGYVDEALTDQNENEIDNDFDEWVDEKIDEVIKKNTSSFSNSDYWLQDEALAILIFLGFFFFTSIIISNLLLHNFSIFIIILGIIGVPFGIFLFLAVSEHTIFFDWLNRHFEKIGLKGFFIISIFITSIMVFYVKPVVENYLKKHPLSLKVIYHLLKLVADLLIK